MGPGQLGPGAQLSGAQLSAPNCPLFQGGQSSPGQLGPVVETLQLTCIPQMLAVFIQYEYIYQQIYVTKPAPEGRTDTLQCLKLKIYITKCTFTNSKGPQKPSNWHIYIPIVDWIYAIPTIHVFFVLYLQYIYICIRFEEHMSVEFIFWYLIRVYIFNIYIYLY